MSRASQQGYVLFTVVVMLFVVATTAYLVSYDSSFKSDQPARELEAARADYVTAAALQHALWQNSHNACVGTFSIPVTALGPDSYTASATGGGTTNAVSLVIDQDGWIRSDDVHENKGTDSSLHIKFEAGNTEQALYRFDLSSLASGTQINSAVAWFYLSAGQTHPEGPITIHRVTVDWTELGATWNTMNGNFESAALATIPAQETGAVWVQVNLTAQVQAWVNGEPNFGILFNTQAEGVHAQYAAREDGSNPPRLDVTVGTSAVTPLNIQATGTLANGVTRTLNRQGVPAYQSPSNIVVQPGPTLDDTYTISSGPGNNYGSDIVFEVGDTGSERYTLIEFDLGTIPVGARILSAELSLNLESVAAAPTGAVITAHRMLEPWTEAGATYNTSDGITSWDWPENYDSTASVVTVPFESPSPGWISLDIRPLVADWIYDGEPNFGLALAGADGVNNARFTSSDGATPSLHPRLSVSFACNCATSCMQPQGNGAILLVVNKDFAMTPVELALQATLESWGYSVTPISDNRSQAEFDTQVALHDVVYVSETVVASQIGTTLTNIPIGVVSEEGNLNDELGIASGLTNVVGSSITIVDNSHEITRPFSNGALEIYAASMEGLTVSGTEAPGLQTLADWGSLGSLVVLDQGAQNTGGLLAAGRRVMLPLGRRTIANFNWNFLSHDGRLLVQRSIEWGMGPNAPPGATSLLLVVGNSVNLTQQEIIKKVLLESWGIAITVIDEDDPQASFDAAIANVDVVFVTEDANSNDVGTKLTNAAIGVVTEEANLSDELGFSDGVAWASGTELNIDNNYFVTSPLASGQVTVLSTSEQIAYLTGNIAPQIESLGSSAGGSGLVALEAGALSTSGSAAGRRILLPWGGNSMDINNLNADGLIVFQRALDWAADFGGATTSSYILSTETDAILGGLSFTDIDLAEYKLWSDTASLFFDGSLSTLNVDIDAVHVLANGHLVLSPSDNTILGGLFFGKDDLVDYNVAANTSTLIFDGNALFTESTKRIISVHVLDNRHFVISTDSNATLGGLSFTDRDLVEYDTVTDTATLFFDGSLSTLNVDIDAVQVLTNGHIVLSPQGNTTLGGVSLAAGDLVSYDPLADTAELIFDGSALFTDPNEKIISVHIGPGSGQLNCNGNFRDEFNATSFSGNDGTLQWVGNWLEVGESDGATSGDIRVMIDESNYQLRTRDNQNGGEGVEREADLVGAASATLTYTYRRDLSGADDYTSVEVSANGAGGPWTELARYQGPGNDASYQAASHNINAYISATTRIRFKTSPAMHGINDIVWFDDIQISCAP